MRSCRPATSRVAWASDSGSRSTKSQLDGHYRLHRGRPATRLRTCSGAASPSFFSVSSEPASNSRPYSVAISPGLFGALVAKLLPILRGWANYFAVGHSNSVLLVFSRLGGKRRVGDTWRAPDRAKASAFNGAPVRVRQTMRKAIHRPTKGISPPIEHINACGARLCGRSRRCAKRPSRRSERGPGAPLRGAAPSSRANFSAARRHACARKERCDGCSTIGSSRSGSSRKGSAAMRNDGPTHT
ncbi:MAG: hypothetical protein E2P02_04110 [Acidobacteria bacterium]|nr:MAG: hypothetical protein E2P02_04110 [Acidobacteriota bacterium]